jgi:hypothetical protein
MSRRTQQEDTMSTTYGITEETKTISGNTRTTYRITRDGQPQGETFTSRDLAEQMLTGWQNIPAGYFLSRIQRGRQGWMFEVSKGAWKTSNADIDKVIRWANEHLATEPNRIARAAERKAEAEAEAALVVAREAAARQAAIEQANRATPRQVSFIMTLLWERKYTKLDGGGFFIGPEDPEDPATLPAIEKMTREQASAFITSLKGDY